MLLDNNTFDDIAATALAGALHKNVHLRLLTIKASKARNSLRACD